MDHRNGKFFPQSLDRKVYDLGLASHNVAQDYVAAGQHEATNQNITTFIL